MGCLYLNDPDEKDRRMDSVMELFPILHEKRRDLASQMSGGQQQMLALGRGLMAGPEVLLLDGADAGTRAHNRQRGVSEGLRDQRKAQHHHPGRRAQHQGSPGHSGPRLRARQGQGRTRRHPGFSQGHRYPHPRLPRPVHPRRRGITPEPYSPRRSHKTVHPRYSVSQPRIRLTWTDGGAFTNW